VIAPLPASTHEDIGRGLAGVLTERQIVLLGSATLGSFVIAREIARAGKPLPLAVAEDGHAAVSGAQGRVRRRWRRRCAPRTCPWASSRPRAGKKRFARGR